MLACDTSQLNNHLETLLNGVYTSGQKYNLLKKWVTIYNALQIENDKLLEDYCYKSQTGVSITLFINTFILSKGSFINKVHQFIHIENDKLFINGIQKTTSMSEIDPFWKKVFAAMPEHAVKALITPKPTREMKKRKVNKLMH